MFASARQTSRPFGSKVWAEANGHETPLAAPLPVEVFCRRRRTGDP